MRNAFDGQRFIAKLINQVHRGEIEAKTGSTLVYMALGLLKFIEAGTIEKRLQELEAAAREMQ